MSTRVEPEKLLTIQMAAELTSYDESTVVRWLSQGLKHCTGAPGRKRPRHRDVRIKASDLWDFVESISMTRSAPGKAEGKAKSVPKGGAGGLSAWRQVKTK